LYPQGTKQVTAQTARLALARLTEVRGQTSDAVIVESPYPAGVLPGARAVEVEHHYGDLALAVELAATTPALQPALDALAGRVNNSQMVRRAGAADRADVRVYLRPADAAGGSRWEIVGAGDRLLAPALPTAAPDAMDRVIENLEKIARYRSLLGIQNPQPDHLLRGKVEFSLLRQTTGGWEEAKPGANGSVVYRTGERVAFRIRNRHTEPVFVSVLDFGLTYAVTPIYPVPGANEKHLPNVRVDFGTQQNRGFVLGLPPGYRDAEGLETLKLIATTRESDFTWMGQPAVRAARRAYSPLEELLRRAGWQARGEAPAVPVAEEWTSVERSFFVIRV
jgi:hypothetical protein